jgi:hypothetical protein
VNGLELHVYQSGLDEQRKVGTILVKEELKVAQAF